MRQTLDADVLVITGPTATGKTSLAVETAIAVGGEVVSADSMQVYKYMNIGTAKPSVEEMRGVPHHMLDVVSPLEDYSVARYVEDASSCVDDIITRGKIPIVAGGTGLYIESLLSGRGFSQRSAQEYRERFSNEYDERGGEQMLTELKKFDPESAARLHYNDKKRIVRAFEVYAATGTPISEHDRRTKTLPPRYTAVKLALTYNNRAVLYDRIDKRVDIMVESGLEAEVKSLLDMGASLSGTAMQAIGYKEMAQAVMGKCTRDEAVEAIKRESRRYAKRQLSWLRRDESIIWLPRDADTVTGCVGTLLK